MKISLELIKYCTAMPLGRAFHGLKTLEVSLAERTNGRTIGTALRPSVVCNVMYCY